MRIIDISWPLHEQMTEYKDRKTVQFKTIVRPDGGRESTIMMHTHTGTHVDAPSHFVPGGKTIDQLPLQALIGPCKVIDMTMVEEKITAENIESCDITAGNIVLFKTKNSTSQLHARFTPHFVYLAHNAATFLVKKGVKAVGFDYLGIERNQPDHATHKTLLQQNIPIIEGLRLDHVPAGSYFLCCLPLRCVGLDAAPARAVLIEKAFL